MNIIVLGIERIVCLAPGIISYRLVPATYAYLYVMIAYQWSYCWAIHRKEQNALAHTTHGNSTKSKISEQTKKRIQIETLIKAKWPNRRISREVNCNIRTVKRWRKKFVAGKSEYDKPRTGRPLKIPEAVVEKMKRKTKDKTKQSLRKNVKWLKKTQDIKVSPETVRSTLKRKGLVPRHRRIEQKLTEEQNVKRVKFATDRLNHNWMHTLMTDESEVQLFHIPNTHNDVVWVRKGDTVPPIVKVSNPPTLKLWAGGSGVGRTKLHVYEGSLTGELYRNNILEKSLNEMKSIFSSQNINHWTFQHDGASAHKDRLTNEWLANNVPEYISSGPTGEWPANSPDLNWMENIWSVIQDLIADPKPPRTVKALRRKLFKIWRELPNSLFTKCANDMPRRLQQVIDTNGAALQT